MMRQVSSPVRRGTRGKGQKWTSPVCLPSDRPTVSLGVTSAMVSSCGHDSAQIEYLVAQ